jgi:hypothetical protein
MKECAKIGNSVCKGSETRKTGLVGELQSSICLSAAPDTVGSTARGLYLELYPAWAADLVPQGAG